ncbi:MAG: rhomboid family intramembrane serine protease, partial [Verrucomicrobia bacterium]|nr:rhomboid family intramembrane serine protease [Verrucomicrobiota bacterium]
MDLWPYLALSLDGLKHCFIWQILNFQFMHAGVLHIFLNMLTLYFIGRILEPA